ncbi:hypothetical protein [Candidatus Liberibacter brunswickensis]|uniref:hypothetical protein n=1 Tax=Candidatus Liberibacter brunswickensis TaxID=1968796 RepID=UPI002FE2A245
MNVKKKIALVSLLSSATIVSGCDIFESEKSKENLSIAKKTLNEVGELRLKKKAFKDG